jgi:hypothetical protein
VKSLVFKRSLVIAGRKTTARPGGTESGFPSCSR